MKFKLLIITLGLLVAFQSPVFAQDDRGGHHPVGVLKAALGLTQEQVTLLRELIQARSAAVKENTAEIEAAKQQMEEETQAELPDPQLIGELVLEIRTLRQEVGEHQRAFQAAFREMLTADQTKRLAQVKRAALMNQAAKVLDHLKLR